MWQETLFDWFFLLSFAFLVLYGFVYAVAQIREDKRRAGRSRQGGTR